MAESEAFAGGQRAGEPRSEDPGARPSAVPGSGVPGGSVPGGARPGGVPGGEMSTAARPDAAAASGTPVAAAVRELETLGERELAEHPDVYQRIHAELQAALATIDNA